MNAIRVPLPPPTIGPAPPPPPMRSRPSPPEHTGGWSLVAAISAVAGIALVWFPGGGSGRPDPAGPSVVEILGVLGGAGCALTAVVLGILLLATAEPRGRSLAASIAAIPLGLVAGLMAAIVAFSG